MPQHNGNPQVSEHMSSEIARLGIYFAFQIHDERAGAIDPWQPLDQLLGTTEMLESWYAEFQRTLESSSGQNVEFRVAASTGHLALVARLICPAFGAALLDHHLDLTSARWQPVIGGVLPLSFPTTAISAGRDISALLTGPIWTLTERTADMSVSPKVLWGNVSSAVNGAVMAAGQARPELADKAMALGRTLGISPGTDFRRSSCCLIYRIAPPGSASYCGDCVLG